MAGSPVPGGRAEATWLNAGAAEVQPGGTDKAPSEAARAETADTAPAGEPAAPAPELAPMSSDDLNIWNPPSVPVAGPKPFASEPDDPSIEAADVNIEAPDVVPETRLVPAVIAVLDVGVDADAVSDANGEVDVDDVAVDATACAAVPTGVPAAWVTATAIPATPDGLVVACGGVNGVMVDAAADAPA